MLFVNCLLKRVSSHSRETLRELPPDPCQSDSSFISFMFARKLFPGKHSNLGD